MKKRVGSIIMLAVLIVGIVLFAYGLSGRNSGFLEIFFSQFHTFFNFAHLPRSPS